VTIVLAGSRMNIRIGPGIDKIAVMTMFSSKPRQSRFQMIRPQRESFCLEIK
jgi:hypothetical protein